MRIIRIVHIREYDWRRDEFKSLAFKNRSDGSGISVIDRDCVDRTGRGVCNHIRYYYGCTAASEPPLYWEFLSSKIPHEHRLENETSASGDICHYNLKGLTKSQARNFFKEQDYTTFRVCNAHGDSPLTRGKVLALFAKYDSGRSTTSGDQD
jgi:hypothetical protein